SGAPSGQASRLAGAHLLAVAGNVERDRFPTVRHQQLADLVVVRTLERRFDVGGEDEERGSRLRPLVAEHSVADAVSRLQDLDLAGLSGPRRLPVEGASDEQNGQAQSPARVDESLHL